MGGSGPGPEGLVVSFGQCSGFLGLAGGGVLGQPVLCSSVESCVGNSDKCIAIPAVMIYIAIKCV